MQFLTRCCALGILGVAPLIIALACLAAAQDKQNTKPDSQPASQAANATENVLGLPAKAMESKGTLLIAGGGKTPAEVYDEFVRLAGGEKAKIVHIPSAHDYAGMENIRRRFYGWLNYQVAKFQFLHTDSRETADSDDFVKPLLEATGVWFSGGDQSRLTKRYAGTKVEAAVHKILERGGVVGGISAGAAVQSRVMLRSGVTEPTLGDGLGLASKAVIDTHFTERSRHTRLLRAIDDRPGFIGLGLDEGAALVVQGNRVRAIGRSNVTVCVTPPEGDPVLVHRLKAGEEADLVQIVAPKIAPTNTAALERRER